MKAKEREIFEAELGNLDEKVVQMKDRMDGHLESYEHYVAQLELFKVMRTAVFKAMKVKKTKK